MKKIFTTLSLTSLLLLSCSKDFINVDPVDTLTTDLVYKTDKDFQDALTAVYAVYRTVYSDFWLFGDVPGDDIRLGLVSNLTVSDVDKFILNSDAGMLSRAWKNYYVIINRANYILNKITTADAAAVPNKDRYIGETKFLRALAYFNLVRIFGDVPMVTSVLSTDESYKIGKEKTAKLYDEVIIADLLDAESKLPLKYTGGDVGRATKGAAKALLGKVYLTVHDFVKAEAKLQEVTTLGYALLPNFNDLFDYTKNEHHSEYIFDIEYEEGINQGSIFTTQFSLSFQGSGDLAAIMAKYYGLPIQGGGDQGCPTESLFSLFESADLRKNISVAKGLTVNGVYTPISPTGIGSFTLKYMVPMLKPNDSKANWKVMRYADVLLMYAEALNENDKTTEALTYLNLVRTRAGVANYSGLSKDDTREKIYLERRLEFVMEGSRWFDLVRTGRAYSTMAPFGMKPYMTIFPIPQAQIEVVNDPAIFSQNQGYD